MATVASMFVKVGARISQFERKMDKVDSRLESLVSEVDRFNARFGSIASLGPAVSPVLASIAGAAGAIGPAFASAGAGIAGFTAVATANLNDVFKAQEQIVQAQKDLAQATTAKGKKQALQERAQALATLSKQQKKALKSLQSFQQFWGKFSKSFQKPVTKAFSNGLKTLETLLKGIKPAIQGTAKAINFLIKKFNKALKSSGMQQFFKFIGKNAGPTIKRFGKTFINIMKGMANIVMAFGPSAKQLEKWLLKLSQKFLKFSKGFQKSKGFHKFMSYVKTNGPKLLKIFKQLALLAIQLLKIMAPLGAQLLTIALHILKMTNSFVKAHPAVVKYTLAILQIAGALQLAGLAFGLMAKPIRLFMSVLKTASTTVKLFTKGLRFMSVMGKRKFRLLSRSFRTSMNVMRGQMKATKARFLKFTKKMKTGLSNLGKKAGSASKSVGKSLGSMAKKAGKAAGKFAKAIGKFIARYALLAARSLIYAARVAASWFIALGPIGWVIAAVIGLVILIIVKWKWIKKWTIKIFGAVWGFLKNIWSKAKNFVVNKANSIWNTVSGAFTGLWHSIRNAMNNAWDSITSIWDKVKNFFENINLWNIGKNIIQGLVRGITSINIPTPHIAMSGGIDLNPWGGIHLPSFDINWYKTGGIFDSASVVGIGEAGPEAVIPLSGSQMQPFARAIASQMPRVDRAPSKQTHIENNFYISATVREEADIEEITDKIYEKQNQSLRASGVNIA